MHPALDPSTNRSDSTSCFLKKLLCAGIVLTSGHAVIDFPTIQGVGTIIDHPISQRGELRHRGG